MLKKSESAINIGTFGLLIVFLIGYTVLKWDYFSLPFYWDEAWSYAKAVFQMYENGPTLNPTQVDQEVFRGHPLFFYFLTSALATLSGWGLNAMHVWMYLLSVLGVVGFYFVIKYWFNASSALIGTSILLASEMFFIQSSMLLPEVLIAFLFIFSIHFFMAKKFVWYFLCASVLVLTKESGLMLFPALGIFVIWDAITERKKILSFIKHGLIYLSPFFVFCLFMLVQKMKWGWYVFPEHVGMMNFETKETLSKLKLFFIIIFSDEGRKYISFLSVVILAVSFIWKSNRQAMQKRHWNLFLVCFLFSVSYAYFSAVNFYTQRYLLSFLPVYALGVSAILFRIKKQSGFKILLSIIILGIGFYMYSIRFQSSSSDISQGQKDMVELHLQVINEFVLPNKTATFNVGFLLSEYLNFPEMGYFNGDQELNLAYVHDADYMIMSSVNSMEGEFKYCQENGNCELVYEKEKNLSWVKVYKIKPNHLP